MLGWIRERGALEGSRHFPITGQVRQPTDGPPDPLPVPFLPLISALPAVWPCPGFQAPNTRVRVRTLFRRERHGAAATSLSLEPRSSARGEGFELTVRTCMVYNNNTLEHFVRGSRNVVNLPSHG